MKLVKAHVKEFRSVNDSTEFEINDITCLVGKNESGKTAILRALYKLNPIIEEHGYFDVTDDYPRRGVSDYEEAVEEGEREPAVVVTATYELENEDISAVEGIYGNECFTSGNPIISLSKSYNNKRIFGGLQLNCRVPDDRIAHRSYPLLAARELLQPFIREQVHGHQAT